MQIVHKRQHTQIQNTNTFYTLLVESRIILLVDFLLLESLTQMKFALTVVSYVHQLKLLQLIQFLLIHGFTIRTLKMEFLD